MILKYKDFKTMTQFEMKNIVGGSAPIDPKESCGTCPSATQGGGDITCYKDAIGSCLKPANCNNSIDCAVKKVD